MTILRLQNIMSNDIAKRSFMSRPPEPPASVLLNDPHQSVFIGTTKLFKVPFTWSYLNLTNPHISVVGITGSGKSYFVKTFLLRASYVWNTNAIIIDWAGEYKAWVNQSGGTTVSLAKGDYINIMDLSGMKPLDRAKQIVTSFEILTDISEYPEQRRLTAEAIEQAYLNAGFLLPEPAPEGKDAPTLKDVISLLEEQTQAGTYAYPAELENAIYRLRQFAREGEDYFARKSTLDIGVLASSGLVDIDLSGLGDDNFRALAALFILQTLKEKMRNRGAEEGKGLKAIVVLDEAWKVAGDDKSDAVTIVREGRKYQFGLIVASQNPTDVSTAIFSNVGTTFILRIKFEKFMNYLQSSLNFSDYIRREISSFGVGQVAVSMAFQTALKFPEIFVLEKVRGEEPLYIYTIEMGDALTQAEIASGTMQREYQMERDELKNTLIEYNIGGKNPSEIMDFLDKSNRMIKMLDFIKFVKSRGAETHSIVDYLKGLGITDQVISRIISGTGEH
jgi:DNA helicase HerA-like ATPase